MRHPAVPMRTETHVALAFMRYNDKRTHVGPFFCERKEKGICLHCPECESMQHKAPPPEPAHIHLHSAAQGTHRAILRLHYEHHQLSSPLPLSDIIDCSSTLGREDGIGEMKSAHLRAGSDTMCRRCTRHRALLLCTLVFLLCCMLVRIFDLI